MSIEKEILDAVQTKQEDGESRTKFLARVVRRANKLKDDDWDVLSDEAQEWLNDAIDALGNQQEVPDFDGEPVSDDEPAAEADASDGDDDGGDDDGGDSVGDDAETEESTDAEEPEPEAKPEPKKVAKSGKKAKGGKAKKVAKKAKADKAEKPAKKRASRRNVDEFGLTVGSKSSKAAEAFKAGAKMADVRKATGITHYNLLARLQKQGHTVKKDKGVITLVPKKGSD